MKLLFVIRCGFFLAATLLVSGCSSMTAFVANKVVFSDPTIRPGTDSVVEKGNVKFQARDGIWLSADLYHPRGLARSSTILVRIPFTNNFDNRFRSRLIAYYWATRGYSVVVQGSRGRYRSGGSYYPLVSERNDGIDTLKWIAGQEWFNGKIAMWGGSAFGYSQWAVSDQKDPGPQAYFIQIASSNFQQMFYNGNAFNLESALYWAIRSHGDRDRKVKLKELDRGLRHVPLLYADDVAIGDTNFFNDWLSHSEKDDYWTKIDGVNRPEMLQAPVLLLGGWFDPFLPSQLEDFRRILTNNTNPSVANETRMIIGPWGHASAVKLPSGNIETPYRAASVLPSIPWFDEQLQETSIAEAQPKARIYVMGKNQWRNENEWPLARTRYTTFYLSSNRGANSLSGDGFLSQDPPLLLSGFDRFTYNPLDPVPTAGGAMLGDRSGIYRQNAVEVRQDVLVYSTPPLTSQVEVTGPVKAILYVETDVPSTDFTAKLVDVHPDGSAYNVSDGILRRSYSNLHRIEQSPVRIEIDLWPTSNVFFRGHKIRLEISSSNFPHYDRNPNTGTNNATSTKMVTANQKVFHAKAYPSQLVLPIIPLTE